MNRDLYSYTQDYINRWVVSYADFVTMLLALFMVMYALSQISMNNIKEFSSSVNNVFEISKANQGSNTVNNINILREKQRLLKIFSTTKTQVKISSIDIPNQENKINDLRTQIRGIEATINKDAIEFQNLERLLQRKLGNTNQIYTKRETRGLIIRLNETILFDPGSDIIKDNARATLDKLAGVLREIPNSVRIEGHTDSQPIKTSRFPSNWELSTARATNIVRYLINNHKLSPQKLCAVGYGEYMPLKGDLSKKGALNRRVDIVILGSTSKILEPQ